MRSAIGSSLWAPEAIGRQLAEIEAGWRQRGLDPDAECVTALACVRAFAGWRYRITREQRQGLIDCSSLVAQSAWLGAAVGTPFIAETQRTAYNTTAVDAASPDAWLPADVLVRHRSRAEAPGGRHNHVALYAGRTRDGRPWLVESHDPHGVRMAPVDDAAADGGVRRFLPHALTPFPDAAPVLRLAAAVPKLGRLGARRTARLSEPPRHRGVDVYFERPVVVRAPFDGVLTREPLRAGARRLQRVAIGSACGEHLVVLHALTGDGPAWRATEVAAGEPLGTLATASCGDCNALPRLRRLPRLHVELWSRAPLGYAHERGLDPPRALAPPLRAFNALYAMKLGIVGLPVAAADAASAVRLPPR